MLFLTIFLQARQVNMGTGLTQIFITGEDASLEDISVTSTEVKIVTTVTKLITMIRW